MAWIDTSQGESAQELEQRLNGLGAKVMTGVESSSYIAGILKGVSSYSDSIVRQQVVVTNYEYRGLTYNAATKLMSTSSDSTSQVEVTSEHRDGKVAKKTGNNISVNIRRSDESGKWTASFTQTYYS